ncbi:MAG: TonB-dependent receptor plug domain-containing protein, partial [Bacteroidota bacterium]
MKRFLFTFFFALTFVLNAFAQRTVTGTVTSSKDGEALPGITVAVEGTPTSVTTDAEGKYRIQVPEGGVLVFFYLGSSHSKLEVGPRSVIDMALTIDDQTADEKVITALGFPEDQDQLGATFSKVEGDAMVQSGETTLLNGLAAKASGLTITRNSGDPGAGAYVQIRGQSTILGSLQPLVVVDGIPITGTTIGNSTSGVAQQSRINDLNPNDIESIQILKGASAVALWGTRAGNGVIFIKTKAGTPGRMRVSYRGAFSVDQVNLRPQVSQNYGQGFDGGFRNNSLLSWGDYLPDRSGGADEVDMAGPRFESNLSDNVYYTVINKNDTTNYNDSNWDDVFQTGTTFDQALTISGGDDQGTYYLSVGDLNQTGVIRNSSAYRRTTARLNTTRKFGEWVRLSNSVQYARVGSSRVQRGAGLTGLLLGLLRTPADFDNRDYLGTYYPNPDASGQANRHRSYRNALGQGSNPRYNNPGFTVNEQINDTQLDRFIVATELTMAPTDWFDMTARIGYDTYSERRDTYFPEFSASFPTGQYNLEIIKQSQLNVDLFGRATKTFGSTVVSALGGFNFNNRRFDRLSGTSQNLIIARDFFNLANATADNQTPADFWSLQ